MVADFGNLVAKYLDLQKKAGSSPKPKKQPAKLAESREQIAAKVLAERADAKLRRYLHSRNFSTGDQWSWKSLAIMCTFRPSRVPGRQLIRGR
jgi:hypothetical protein